MSKLVPYKRSKIRSTESQIFISKEHFPEIIRRLKIHRPSDDEIQKSISLWSVVNHYGWHVSYDKDGNVCRLYYRSDEWELKSITLLSVMSSYIDAGGYVKMTNEKTNTNWVYKFNGKLFRRQTLITRIIDFKDKKNLETHFNEVTLNMFELGMTKGELIHLIKKLFIQKILK
jgi:hypothetical protein